MMNLQHQILKTGLLLNLLVLMLLPADLPGQCTFSNPVLEGADPFVTFHDGYYYMLVTRADRVAIKRAVELQRIHEYNEIVVWRFQNTPVGGHVWAPEMFNIDGKWYIYTCGQNTGIPQNQIAVPYVQKDQQMFVLESQSDDPLGPYIFKSWLLEGIGAIDETIFSHTNGKRYIIWSQFNNPGQPQSQCLYIAELINAWTVGTTRIEISCPELAWERNGWPVNEGPAVLQRNGKTYIVYSGSGYTTPEYSLGYLVNTDGNLLNAGSWTKSGPVFQQNPEGGVYSTGHNSFTRSPDGSEDWIVYHGRLSTDGNTSRYVFMQKFLWKGDEPHLGIPVPAGEQIPCPSKSRGDVVAIKPFDQNDNVVTANREDGKVWLWKVEPDSALFFQQQARYTLVPGLSDFTGISLEFHDYPGYYLRNQDGEIHLHAYDGTDIFRSEATFYERDPWWTDHPGNVSLETHNQPGSFVRHRNELVYAEAINDNSLQSAKEDATWQFDDASAILSTADQPVNDMFLYPNPVKDYLYVELPVQWSGPSVKVFDIMGRVKISQDLHGNSISVVGLEDGLYLLCILSGNSLYCGHFIKAT